jgi:MSHA biogenesis protein MshG
MPIYQYQARNSRGSMVTGEINAANEETVATQLLDKQLTPISMHVVKTKGGKKNVLKIDIIPRRVKSEDLMILCRQLYTLTKAGVAITDSLKELSQSTDIPKLQKALLDCHERIISGQTLSQALKFHPKLFSKMFISIVDAGENSGQLELAFAQLAKHLELDAQTKKRIKSATRYPIMVISAILIALLVINFMVVPAFLDMFKQFKTTLPLPTRILMATSNFLTNHWMLLIIGIIVVIVVLKYFIKTPQGRYFWDYLKLRIPIIGNIIERILLGRFARTFTTIMRTGVPLIAGIGLVANAVGNEYVRRKILAMREGIERGETLTKSATESNLFSPLVLQMIKVGESSGEIDVLLEEVAEFYESEVDYDLGRLSEMIEPILLVVMGGMVLMLALGVFLPMWNMISFVKH